MSEPRVTVVIDTYNHGHLIEEAIDSVLSQEFPADQMEILVIDDGSTDDTAERVKKYGARLEYFRKPNGGQASAFNLGVPRAQGEIVALLDGDDYWLPDKLRSIVAEFDAHPETGLVYHSLREYCANTGKFQELVFTPISGFLPSDIKQVILFDWMYTSCISFRRDLLEQFLPIPEGLRIQADGYLCVLAMLFAPIIAIERPLGIYRIHGKNLFSNIPGETDARRVQRRIDSSREMVKALTVWLTSHGYDIRRPEARMSILRWVLMAEREEFLLSPPGRMTFFLHLLKSFRQQEPLMTPRIRAVNYFNAAGALIVGYGRFHMLDENRKKITRCLRQGIGHFLPSPRERPKT
jgi:glycosyltransferase involved in cell wall biosynthesis